VSPIDLNRLKTPSIQTKGGNQSQSPDDWLTCNKILEFSNIHSDIITVESRLNGKLAIALIDTGASGNFISKEYLNRGSCENVAILRRFITTVDEKKVKLADGSTIKTNHLKSNHLLVE